MDNFCEILKKINSVLWGNGYILLVFACFVFLSAKTKFSALNIFKSIRICKKCFHDKSKRSAVFTSLASSMGTGNIIGTASALKIGGEGSIFWMIIAAMFGMSAAYAENYLGRKYNLRKSANAPFSYISDMPFGRYFSLIYAVSCVLAAVFTGNMIQGNALVSSLHTTFGGEKIILALIFSLIIGFVAAGGGKRIKNTADKLIPFLSVLYIIMCIVGTISNYKNIPYALEKIINGASDFKSFIGGSVGGAISVGLRRGTFSNEAGMGSSVLVISDMKSSPDEAGLLSAMCVFFDTVICCTLTALFIITSGVPYGDNAAGEAFSLVFGKRGEITLSVMTAAFAFASIIGWCLYGEKALEFLSRKASVIKIYRLLACPIFFIGALCTMKLLWQFSDICDFLMLTINLFAVVIAFLS